MLFSTTTQYVVLALALVAGWLFGLASASGGRKWRDRYAAERDAHAATRTQAERVADTRRGADDRLAQANARIAELERDNARLASAAPVAVDTRAVPGDTPVYAPDPVRPAATSVTAVRPAFAAVPAGTRRGWFDWQ